MLKQLQKTLVDVCCSDDACRALDRALQTQLEELEPSGRAWLEDIDRDGLKLTSLLLRQHRLDRVLDGDPELRGRYEDAPADFIADFREYLETVDPVHAWPAAEAAAFREFMELLG